MVFSPELHPAFARGPHADSKPRPILQDTWLNTRKRFRLQVVVAALWALALGNDGYTCILRHAFQVAYDS